MGRALTADESNPFDPRLQAEQDYNLAISGGLSADESLHALVTEHMRRYPNGIDATHRRHDKAPRE